MFDEELLGLQRGDEESLGFQSLVNGFTKRNWQHNNVEKFKACFVACGFQQR